MAVDRATLAVPTTASVVKVSAISVLLARQQCVIISPLCLLALVIRMKVRVIDPTFRDSDTLRTSLLVSNVIRNFDSADSFCALDIDV